MALSTVQIPGGQTVCLRSAVPEDAAELIRAIDSVAREGAYFLRSRFEIDEKAERTLLSAAQERGDLVLVGKARGRVVTWLTALRGTSEFQRHAAELGTGVVREWRGRGVGSALIEHALEWAAAQGVEKVRLGVRAENDRARHLYIRFGFVEEGYRLRDVKDSTGTYYDVIEMAWFAAGESEDHRFSVA
ncbi:MAG TPA: GNAT family N-acetyltransferase [Anaerolineae bacterium]|nr:GNAT family N-acetyltransferase [Anaerolineae bacterium]